MGCILCGDKLEGLYSACSTSDNYYFLVFCVLPVKLRGVVDFPLELLLTRDVRHFGFSTGFNGGNNTIKYTI